MQRIDDRSRAVPRNLPLLAGLLAFLAGGAGGQSVRVVSDVLVDAGPPRSVQEPHIAIDPRNPNHVVAAVIVVPPMGALVFEQHCSTVSSSDGGAHWVRHDFPIRECYDPWVAYLPDGSALFSALGSDPILGGAGNGLLVYRSRDGGATWVARPAGLSWGWDHPMLVVDNSLPKRRGWVYEVSSRDLQKDGHFFVAVARSVDGGKTFSEPHNIAAENTILKAESPVVLSDGTLIVSYVEVAVADQIKRRRSAWVSRSTNGIDFEKATFVGEVCGPPPTYLMSWLTVDASTGPMRDRLYFACSLPNISGIAISHSADGGKTWSPPKSATRNPSAKDPQRVLMASAVSSNGVLGVVWLEHRAGSPANCRDTFIAVSFDGGETFETPARVSQESSCPDPKQNGPFGGYGDYFALAGDSQGRFRVAYIDARRGLLQLRTALIEVTAPARR